MTYKEIREAALERCAEFGLTFPEVEAVSLRRIGTRQYQLFVHANAIDPDYYGVCAEGAPVGGALDLRDVVDPVHRVDRVLRVSVVDKGTSTTVANGDKIHVISSADVDAFYAPRMTLRDWVLKQVGTDLDGVAKIKVSYARISLAVTHADGAVQAELTPQFQDLLVLDLAQYMVRKVLDVEPAAKEAVLALLKAEETELMVSYTAHVEGFAAGKESRFGNSGDYR